MRQETVKATREANEAEQTRGYNFARKELVKRIAQERSIREKDVILQDAFFHWGFSGMRSLEIDIPIDSSYLFQRGVEIYLDYVKSEIIEMFPPKTKTISVEIR